MRRVHVCLILYLNNILVMESSLEEILMSRYALIFISHNLSCKNLSEICFEYFSSNAIPGGRNRLLHHDSNSSFAKEGTDQFTMLASIEPIRCHIKANKPRNKSSFIRSNSCSSSTHHRSTNLELAAEKQSFNTQAVLLEEVREEIPWWIENLMLF